MKVYLSARYARMSELAVYRDELADHGIGCTSTWLTGSTFENSTANAVQDIDDVYAADAFVAFAEEPVEFSDKPYASRGGRHVEFGVAFETGLPIIVVGPRENVFHLLPGVMQVDTWEDALRELQELAIREMGDRILKGALAEQRRARRQKVRS